MSDDEVSRVLSELGEIRGTLKGMSQRIRSLDKNLDVVRSAHEQNGKAIAELNERCRFRGKQLSDVYSKIGQVRETTEVMRIKELQGKETDDKKKIILDAKYKWLTIIVLVVGLFLLGGLKILDPKDFLPIVIAIALTAGIMAVPQKK